MVTLAFFLVIILLSVIVSFFDTMIFGYSFLEAAINLFYTEIAVGKYIVLLGIFSGMISSVIIDIRIHLNKKSVKENQT